MGRPTGFIEVERLKPRKRAATERVNDAHEFELPLTSAEIAAQASRCMDCGVPFCHQGCPLGNVIPDWNDLVYRGRWREAIDRLHATNNFPEFTGRICPAPCEASCVLELQHAPVTIRHIEQQIVDHAFEQGWVVPIVAPQSSGRSVAVIGSGPAGLACAQQLAREGHSVTVYERSDRIGGLLRYGIPDFKLEKFRIDRRVAQMELEGVRFRTGIHVGVDVTGDGLRKQHDAIVLALGAGRPRDLDVPGRTLAGVHHAMEYLELSNRHVAGDAETPAIDAKGRHVVILGGGDTGADCVGTAHRQGAASVTQLELMPRPPEERSADRPWPEWPLIFRTSPAHEEGGTRLFARGTEQFVGDANGRVEAIRGVAVSWETADGSRKIVRHADRPFDLRADLVLLALGFTGVETNPLYRHLGVSLDARGVVTNDEHFATDAPGVFVCGDARRGASLVVWAIAEGRDAARSVSTWLAQSHARRTG